MAFVTKLLKDEDVAQATLELIKAELQEVAEERIEQAVRDYEVQLRSRMGEIVLKMLSRYSVERNGSELCIRVELADTRR